MHSSWEAFYYISFGWFAMYSMLMWLCNQKLSLFHRKFLLWMFEDFRDKLVEFLAYKTEPKISKELLAFSNFQDFWNSSTFHDLHCMLILKTRTDEKVSVFLKQNFPTEQKIEFFCCYNMKFKYSYGSLPVLYLFLFLLTSLISCEWCCCSAHTWVCS